MIPHQHQYRSEEIRRWIACIVNAIAVLLICGSFVWFLRVAEQRILPASPDCPLIKPPDDLRPSSQSNQQI